MVIYDRYINTEEHIWYDSSNVIYSKCYDNPNSEKVTLKMVFKNGRTYIYKNIDVHDYLGFKLSESNGKGFNEYIKKYECFRVEDTDLEELNKLKETFQNDNKKIDNEKFGDISYTIECDEKTGMFVLKIGDKTIFNGIEGKVSIVKLLTSMNIKFSINVVDNIDTNIDEEFKK